LRVALFTALLLALLGIPSGAQEMTAPRVSFASVDWPAALATLSDSTPARLARARWGRLSGSQSVPPVLARLNAAMAERLPGIRMSPVPVLLPFDTAALLRDQASGQPAADDERYLAGFHARKFFFPGPSGYDAALAIRTAEIPELADIKFAEPIQVVMSGSALLYQLDDETQLAGSPVKELENDFPGIRRLLLEHHLRYTFVRFGVPYVVSVGCFDGSVPRYRMPTCRSAERVVLRFLQTLRIVGGTPQPRRQVAPLPIERPTELSPSFSYHAPGQLLAGTGFRGLGGRADNTVYAQIRFPLAGAPAFVNSQMFQRRNPTSNYGYPWRDNFCERRGFPVSQCPAGAGHQGQDIRALPCTPEPGADRCRPRDALVAVRDGAILRAPRQEAAYLFVNTANEHVRFRYLHMNPRQMDEDNLLSGRLVKEGEVIGQIGNFDRREGGTSYHLHFDLQVPTKNGWVFVNPYMTLVAAYERLIGARGEQRVPPTQVAAMDGTAGSSIATPRPEVKPQAVKRSRHAKRAAHKKRPRAHASAKARAKTGAKTGTKVSSSTPAAAPAPEVYTGNMGVR
jgi:murein DD-endopeptidase MepM/ murein hydrolase activator NlpD